MSRTYTELSCGCQVSCDDGGGLIPCENEGDCKSYRYTEEHRFCDFCGNCIVCYDHIFCCSSGIV